MDRSLLTDRILISCKHRVSECGKPSGKLRFSRDELVLSRTKLEKLREGILAMGRLKTDRAKATDKDCNDHYLLVCGNLRSEEREWKKLGSWDDESSSRPRCGVFSSPPESAHFCTELLLSADGCVIDAHY
ncbi:hypothetical protein AVEN_145200-1 [Araneus ventricosus]|uniref:Uncharacterized protein n=1 Tax=Araneus ventricosus TaxID=182803 RepID=A0A4Y2Q655_ARAVE|nr:hypothetical protein AVEN_145200-1 [Araneus ventricosus]